jgi:hypothetical protein
VTEKEKNRWNCKDQNNRWTFSASLNFFCFLLFCFVFSIIMPWVAVVVVVVADGKWGENEEEEEHHVIIECVKTAGNEVDKWGQQRHKKKLKKKKSFSRFPARIAVAAGRRDEHQLRRCTSTLRTTFTFFSVERKRRRGSLPTTTLAFFFFLPKSAAVHGRESAVCEEREETR